jgi:protein-tyrosine phosphatase
VTDQIANVLHPARRILLDGCLNFRDAGGYLAADGMRMRWGHLFRSDQLSILSDADHVKLAGLGLSNVYDLRIQSERDRQPSRLPDIGIETCHVGLADTPEERASVDMVLDIIAGRHPWPGYEFWVDGYRAMVDKGRSIFVAVISGLVDRPGPSLIHCTGGKDRTGIAVALVHRMLGVDDGTVTADFLLTNLFRTPPRLEFFGPQLTKLGLQVSDAWPVLGVIPEALQAAMDKIDAEFGGPEAYLVSGGMDPSVPDRLRDLLLEPVS